MSRHTTVGILLAAGFGRRFDPHGQQNKLLQLLDNGVPVAVQSARSQLQALDHVVAVVQSAELAGKLSEAGCHPLMFADAREGMGASLAHAMQYVMVQYPDATSVLVGLADMPYISAQTIALVLEELDRAADIVQPVFGQQGGHPVGFSRRHFAALLVLQGDAGARRLLREFPVVRLAVDDPGVIRDIDYPADLLPQ